MKVREVLFALTKAGGSFHYRRHFVAVPNLSWGLLEWEADLAVITDSGWLVEVEIKVDATDWKNDKDKSKWAMMHKSSILTPRRFYYAAPEKLALRWEEFGIPEWAGVVSVKKDNYGRMSSEVIRKAANRDNSRQLKPDEMLKVARLASMRFWTENHKVLLREEWAESNKRAEATT